MRLSRAYFAGDLGNRGGSSHKEPTSTKGISVGSWKHGQILQMPRISSFKYLWSQQVFCGKYWRVGLLSHCLLGQRFGKWHWRRPQKPGSNS